MKPGRRRRWILGTLAACAALAVLRAAAPWYVRTRVLPSLGAAEGATVTADDVSLSVLAASADVTRLRIAEGDRELLTAPRVEADLDLVAFLGGRLVVERLVVERPVAHARLEARGSTDADRVARKMLEARPGDAPAIVLEDVRIDGATVVYEDAVTRPEEPLRVELTGVRATARGLQVAGRPSEARRGSVEADGHVAQIGPPAGSRTAGDERSGAAAPFTILAQAEPDGAAQRVVAHAAVTGFRLSTVPQYVSATQRTLLGADELDVVVTTEVRGGEILRGAAVATIPGRDQPLVARFSGPVADPAVDPSGSLTALFELPFAHLGQPGSVVWGATSSVVGGAVGFVENLAALDVAEAGKSVVGGVARGVGAVGRGIADAVGGLGRALGIGGGDGAPAGEDAAHSRDLEAVHAKVRASLVAGHAEAAR